MASFKPVFLSTISSLCAGKSLDACAELREKNKLKQPFKRKRRKGNQNSKVDQVKDKNFCAKIHVQFCPQPILKGVFLGTLANHHNSRLPNLIAGFLSFLVHFLSLVKEPVQTVFDFINNTLGGRKGN